MQVACCSRLSFVPESGPGEAALWLELVHLTWALHPGQLFPFAAAIAAAMYCLAAAAGLDVAGQAVGSDQCLVLIEIRAGPSQPMEGLLAKGLPHFHTALPVGQQQAVLVLIVSNIPENSGLAAANCH